ncbi:hypothetical protein BOTNAR_0172g00130 [Botryotinia narcissicola]|uniref:NAD(P)-binding domain-containing protein n=1 Tax=Botryotinia narcissicola TaxID=278944 RepID=A0A4Z1IBQ3_9HELO|nr:hypothetical protein BOTNAR_0172g00130 [Botryotinia narcissicola]
MVSSRDLIFGRNGGIGRLIAESMLLKSWHVASVIRDPRQEVDILQLKPKGDSKAGVLVVDLVHMKEEDASKILKEIKPNYIVFSAGNECYGYSANTFAKLLYCSPGNMSNFDVVDLDATMGNYHGIRYLSRGDKISHDIISCLAPQESALTRAYPEIVEKKLNADEYMVVMSKQRNDDSPSSFQTIGLRPIWLTNTPRDKTHLGKTKFSGGASRADFAVVTVSFLSRSDTSAGLIL